MFWTKIIRELLKPEVMDAVKKWREYLSWEADTNGVGKVDLEEFIKVNS